MMASILQYSTIKTGSTVTIVLRCPACGRMGKLMRNGFNTCGPRFRISHDDDWCNFSYFDGEIYDELKKIYESVRLKR